MNDLSTNLSSPSSARTLLLSPGLLLFLFLFLFLLPLPVSAAPPYHIRIAALQLGPTPSAPNSSLLSMALEVRLRTSLEVASEVPWVRPESRAIFKHPLLYWAGDNDKVHMSDKGIANLRQHLLTGGTLIVDNTGRAGPSASFDAEVRRVLRRAMDRPLKRIPSTHVLFRSFYRLTRPVGRRADTGYLEGIRVGKNYAAIYFRDDLTGAFLRTSTGEPALRVVPRGEYQREQAFRLAINLIMYTVCLDYKDDHTHITYLLRTRRGHTRSANRGANPRTDPQDHQRPIPQKAPARGDDGR